MNKQLLFEILKCCGIREGDEFQINGAYTDFKDTADSPYYRYTNNSIVCVKNEKTFTDITDNPNFICHLLSEKCIIYRDGSKTFRLMMYDIKRIYYIAKNYIINNLCNDDTKKAILDGCAFKLAVKSKSKCEDAKDNIIYFTNHSSGFDRIEVKIILLVSGLIYSDCKVIIPINIGMRADEPIDNYPINIHKRICKLIEDIGVIKGDRFIINKQEYLYDDNGITKYVHDGYTDLDSNGYRCFIKDILSTNILLLSNGKLKHIENAAIDSIRESLHVKKDKIYNIENYRFGFSGYEYPYNISFDPIGILTTRSVFDLFNGQNILDTVVDIFLGYYLLKE